MSENYCRRHLPHWQPYEANYFITFRLAGTLPRETVKRLKDFRRKLNAEIENENISLVKRSSLKRKIELSVFEKYEHLLDGTQTGPTWLSKSVVAKNIVTEALHYRDQQKYDLYAYSIMPNHVHIVFQLLEEIDKQPEKNTQNTEYPITKILQSLKSYTALKANEKLNRQGAFWQSESYDHVVKDTDELERVIGYTLNNPVKAGLVKHWKD